MLQPSWFIGEVVDTAGDPQRLGRVRVKVYLTHDFGVKTEDLLWSHVMMPTTSPSVAGVGDTPTLLVGSKVIGFYADGDDRRVGVVIGTMPFNPSDDVGSPQHSLSFLARGENSVTKEKLGSEEPDPAYAAEYSLNRVIQTRSGHVIELDDTPGAERIHIVHKSGTYAEINSTGRLAVGVKENSYEAVQGDRVIEIQGNARIFVKGNVNIGNDGDMNIATNGNLYLGAKGTVTIESVGGTTINSAGGVSVRGKGGLSVEGPITTFASLSSASGATATFTTPSGRVVTVSKGIVTKVT